MRRLAVFAISLIASLVHAAEKTAEPEGPDAPKEKPKPSSLAPTVTYQKLHTFLHAHDSTPKLLLLQSAIDDSAGAPPGWYTSAAMSFKEGKKKTASFAVMSGKDSDLAARRFGIDELPRSGALYVCVVDGSGGGYAVRYVSEEAPIASGGGALVRAVKALVKDALGGDLPEDERVALPAFPAPDVPRKQASVSLVELTYDNLPTHCFGGSKAVCVIALTKGKECPSAFESLARRHRNDNVQFAWLPSAPKQAEFVKAFVEGGLEGDRVVAVKAGKRMRFALLEGEPTVEAAGAFVDRILGGDMQFSKLSSPPELEPHYLLDKDEP